MISSETEKKYNCCLVVKDSKIQFVPREQILRFAQYFPRAYICTAVGFVRIGEYEITKMQRNIFCGWEIWRSPE